MKHRSFVCGGGDVCIQKCCHSRQFGIQAWIPLSFPGREGALLSPSQRERPTLKIKQAKEWLIFKTDQVKNSGWEDLLQTASLPRGLKDVENCV